MSPLYPLLGLLQVGQPEPLQFRGGERALRVEPPRIEATIEVDGLLDEPVWSRAARLTGFSQFSPSDGRPAEDSTLVLVWYSPAAIHFAVLASASPGTVRANLADRDKGIQSDDYVEIQLGTFNDGHQAFVFAVNPLGVQADGALSEGSTRRTAYSGAERGGREPPDLSPDFVFQSKGRVTADGYQVEIRIPFRTLRYQAAARQDWSLQVVRRVAATGREDTWAPASRAATSFIGQSGTLVGLQGLERGRVVEITPIVTSTVTGFGSGAGWEYGGGRPEPGGNVKWGISNDLTFNGTVNPDFSQVESDAGQLASDPRRAIFFAEKRPFFLDGLEHFTTPSQVIYTRRIADPSGAAKVTGRIAGASFGLLSAVDGRSTSATGRHRPVYHILRAQRTIGGSSQLGFAYTDRIEGGDYNRVAQIDGRLALGPVTSMSFYGAASRTRTGQSAWTAPMGYGEFRHTGRRFGLMATVNAVSDRFVAGSGFIAEPDIAQGTILPSVTLYGRRGALLERFTGSIYGDLVWAYPDFRSGAPARDRRIMPRANLTFRGGWDLGLTVYAFNYGYDGRLFRNYAIELPNPGGGADTIPYPEAQRIPSVAGSVTLRSPEVAGLLLDVYFAFGDDLNYSEWSKADVWLGRFSLAYRPTPRLRGEGLVSFQSYHRSHDGSFVSRIVLPRLKVEYQVSRAIFLRAVAEYRAFRRADLRDVTRTEAPILIRDPGGAWRRDLAVAADHNSLRADFLFSFQPTPGTVFFAGYGSSLVDADAFGLRRLERVADNFFVKLSYLLRL